MRFTVRRASELARPSIIALKEELTARHVRFEAKVSNSALLQLCIIAIILDRHRPSLIRDKSRMSLWCDGAPTIRKPTITLLMLSNISEHVNGFRKHRPRSRA